VRCNVARDDAVERKWVFKLKRDEAGAVIKQKERLVARGFVQQGVDFHDALAPIARMESVRVLLALAAQEGWRVHHMDVKSAFRNGDLKEEVCIRQPPGFVIIGKENKVVRLRKALYGWRPTGLEREAGRHTEDGFPTERTRGRGLPECRGSSTLLVDNLVITGTKEEEVEAVKAEMKVVF